MYSVDYFIKKFEAIPKNMWKMDSYTDGVRCCALGHCGQTYNGRTYESVALINLIGSFRTADVNDGKWPYKELGDHPKERILNALVLVKAGLWEEANDD